MNYMSTPNELQKQGYSGVKVSSMIKALKLKLMYKHLRLVQQNELCEIENFYNKHGFIDKKRFSFIWFLYWNFVLNDFRFEDKTKVASIPSKIKKTECPCHIGMKIYQQLKQKSRL